MNDVQAGRENVAGLLARFPGPVTLHRSKQKWLGLVAIGMGFVALGAWMILDPAAVADTYLARRLTELLTVFGLHLDAAGTVALVGWITVAFFGLGTLVSVLNLLPGASELTLDAGGFAVTSLFRRRPYAWTKVNGFTVVRVRIGAGTKKFVGYDDQLAAEGAVARANVALTGRNSALPDSFGLTVEDLSSIMARWRERALSGSP